MAHPEDQPIEHVPGQIEMFAMEEIMGIAHTPTRCTGTVQIAGGEVTYDYVGCSVCRIDHPTIGRNVPQPWDKAHPSGLPATATEAIPDPDNVRQ